MGALDLATWFQSTVQTSANIQSENHTHACQRHPEESVNSQKHLVKKNLGEIWKWAGFLKKETEEYQVGKNTCTMVSSTVS